MHFFQDNNNNNKRPTRETATSFLALSPNAGYWLPTGLSEGEVSNLPFFFNFFFF